MIKILALVLTIVGIIGLILGVLGIFGSSLIGVSPWALAILGFIFFFSGISILKRKRDTDEVI
ncbi:hypothetical protein LVD15_08230 [Fulvivirga maritima]|uniref:hypothetical protein n=1 Tax=Fulvivirga maritima TaxID=2904247 RepID=UPI001F282970|nr:hypothetical protein [Fulvivirga maritima]UII28403.1 hypothetical protein LVD15_08230 [Fulvivirga maritima]